MFLGSYHLDEFYNGNHVHMTMPGENEISQISQIGARIPRDSYETLTVQMDKENESLGNRRR